MTYEVWYGDDLYSRHNDRREAERNALSLWRHLDPEPIGSRRRVEVWHIFGTIPTARLVRAFGAR